MATAAQPTIAYEDLLRQGQAQQMTPQPQVTPGQVATLAQQSAPSEAERLNTYAYGHPAGPNAMAQAQPQQAAQAANTPQNKIDWKNFLSRPEVKAGFLQMGINMLAGQGIGSSMGAGAEATGRASQIIQRQQAEAAAAAGRSGGGSSGGGGGGGGSSSSSAKRPTKLKDMTWTQFNKQLDDYLQASAGLGGDAAVLTPGERQQMWERAIDVEVAGGSALGWVDVALTQGLDTAEQMYQATISQMNGDAPAAKTAANAPAAPKTNATAAPTDPAAAPEAGSGESSVWEKFRSLF